ncbi:hypothetical protein NQZ68_016228, partial [Dissostichus eleginoides]
AEGRGSGSAPQEGCRVVRVPGSQTMDSPVEHLSLGPIVGSQNLKSSLSRCSTTPHHQHLLTHDTQAPTDCWEELPPALPPLDFD